MPPLKSAKKLQPQIVLDDIFKNKSNISKRKNAVTIVGPPWSRRFSADSNKRSLNIPHNRAINLRSRCHREVIAIKDDTDISKQRKSIETKDSDAARTRGLPVGNKRKIETTIKNESEPDVTIIDDKTNVPKLSIQCESTEMISGKARLRSSQSTTKPNKKVANNSQCKIGDRENRSSSSVNAINDKSNIPKTTTMRKVDVASRKRGRPCGSKNKKIASERKIDNGSCSCFDVIIMDDNKTEIPKLVTESETKETIAGTSEMRNSLSNNDVENVLNAILKEKDNIVQEDGELVSERHSIWQHIRHELEYQVTAQTLRRIAKSPDVYKLLKSQELKDENVVPTVNTADVAEIGESKYDENTTRFVHVLEKLSETIDCLSKAIKEHGKALHLRNNSAQNRQ